MRLAASLLVAALASAQSLDTIRAEFRDPPKSRRPLVRWWWPGGDVTPEQLRKEVAVLDAAGFGGAEIQAFRISLPRGAAAAVDDYPTASFYAKVRAAAEEARRRGLFLDLTLGSGWPFGGGDAITPERATLELRTIARNVTGPTAFRERANADPSPPHIGMRLARLSGVSEALPDGWTARLAARTKVIAAVAVRGSPAEIEIRNERLGPRRIVRRPGLLDPKSAVLLPVSPAGEVAWKVPAGSWQIFLFEQRPAGLRVIGGAGAGPQLVMDHLDRAALDAHWERILGPARQPLAGFFGSTIRAVFCDSLEVEAELPWSEGFLAEFRKRRGYDLTPWLPFLRQPGWAEPYGEFDSPPEYDGDGAAQVRQDYRQTVSDLWLERFFRPFREKAQAEKLLARVQAHGAPVNVLAAYASADIPETEQLYAGGDLDFLKLAASGARLAGRRIVAAEAFVHAGKAYQSTRETLERDTHALLAAGINQFVYHGFPYEYLDRPDPGWHPFSGALSFSDHFNPRARIWSEVPRLNQYIARLQVIAQQGRPLVRYAYYRPVLHAPNRSAPPPLATRDYDHLDRATLLASRVRGAKLVTPAGMEYEALVLAADDAEIRTRFPKLRTFVKEVPAGDAPARWRLADSEFRFYWNDTAKPKTYDLGAGRFEVWEAATGEVRPLAERFLTLESGAAVLLRRR